jgi:hypothetical protein
MKMPLQPLPEPDAHEKKPAGWDAYFQSYSKDQVQAIQRQAYEDGLRDAAKACKQLETAIDGGGNVYYRPADARQCVSAIDAMLNTPKEAK